MARNSRAGKSPQTVSCGQSVHEGEYFMEDKSAIEQDEMEGCSNSILRTGNKQESKSKCDVSAQLDFTEPVRPYKNYPKPKPLIVSAYGMLLDIHTHGFVGVAGNTQITAVHLSLTWLPQRRSIQGSNGTHSPLLPLLHLPHDPISAMCPAKLPCGQSTPRGKFIHTFMW